MTITLERDGEAINLSTVSSVDLYIKLGTTVTNSGHTACTVTEPLDGVISYSPEAADFATAGTYDCEVKITYGDATVETIYEKFTIKARTKLST